MESLASESLSAGLVRRSWTLPVKRNATSVSHVCIITLVLADICSLGLLLGLSRGAVLGFSDHFAISPRDVSSGSVALMGAAAVFAVLIGTALLTGGDYAERPSFWCEARRLTAVSGLTALISLLWPFSNHELIPHLFTVALWLLFPMWALALRQMARRALSRAGLWKVPVIVFAPSSAMGDIERTLNSRQPADFDVVATFDLDRTDARRPHDWPVLLQQHQAQRLVVVASAGLHGYDQLFKSIVHSRIAFMVVLENGHLPVYGAHLTRSLRSDTILISYRTGMSRPLKKLLKTTFDLLFASVLLSFLAPLLVCLSALVALDGGPILFAHERIGKGGRRFRCFKFRTMSVDGNDILLRALANDPAAAAQWTATRKLTRDPRVTRFGGFLRKTSLDELPQLLNVLRREMSIVGPRPIVADELPYYAEDITFYYEARPGLTGLWQVSGRSDTSYEQRVAFDRWYVKNWTMWHDFVILVMTLPAVLAQRGAR